MNPKAGKWVKSPADKNHPEKINICTENGYFIALVDFGAHQEDNANLIAEAGTVYHETGLTPRQLAEQRDELLEALKLCKFDSLNMTLADLTFIRNVYAIATKGE